MSHPYFDRLRPTPPTPLQTLLTALACVQTVVATLAAPVDLDDRAGQFAELERVIGRAPGYSWSLRTAFERVVAADKAGEAEHLAAHLNEAGYPQTLVSALVRAAEGFGDAIAGTDLRDVASTLDAYWATKPIDEISVRRILRPTS